MYFFMENDELREDLRDEYPEGVYTLHLIRDGKRTATTRPYPLGKEGEKVILYNSRDPQCEDVKVEITGTEKLDIRTTREAELWSLREGWSVEYLVKNPHLCQEWQTTFKIAE
jgi:hypothetical protein